MKNLFLLSIVFIIFMSCSVNREYSGMYSATDDYDTSITQSLFNDKNSTISEENIRTILEGKYTLQEKLRVALVKLESKNYQPQRSYYWNWTSEEYLKTQQSYIDLFSQKLYSSQRVINVSVIPDLLISSNPTFTLIRESAVRMQADVVAIYSITNELYTKYKVFKKDELKAFATIQFIILDVRTGLIPFSTIVTKDYQSQELKSDFEGETAKNRVKNEAVLLSINEIGGQLNEFLKTK